MAGLISREKKKKKNKQGTYIPGLSWAPQDGADLRTGHQNLKMYIKALMGFSHVYGPSGWSQPPVVLSRLRPWGSSWCEEGKQMHIPRTGEKGGAASCPGPAQGSTRSHVLSMTSSNTPPLRQALTTLHPPSSVAIDPSAGGPSAWRQLSGSWAGSSQATLEADPTAAIEAQARENTDQDNDFEISNFFHQELHDLKH